MDKDWIKEGAPVLVARFAGGAHDTTVHRSTIVRVTRTQFAVDGVDQRFKLDTRRTASAPGGRFSSSRYQAYAIDDPVGLRLLERHTRNVCLNVATSAVYRWQREHTRANRLELIVALTALEQYGDL